MANSTDFNGSHLKMRNGHDKTARATAAAARPRGAAPADRRRTGRPTTPAGPRRARRRNAARLREACASSVDSRLRAPIRSTPSCTSAARAPSRIRTGASSSRWRARRSRRAGASLRRTSSSPSTSARPACTATRTRARRAYASSCTARRTPSAAASRRASRGQLLRHKADADAFEAELSLYARRPGRRVQFAGLVQPRPLARIRHRGLGRQLGVGPRRAQNVVETKPTPTSARSARRASSRPSRTT